MSDLTDDFEVKLLKHIFNISALASYTEMHIALSTSTITDAGGNMTEPSGGGYLRAKTYMADWAQVGSTSVIDNNDDIEFPEATGAWGTITDIALMDASTSGNMIAYKALASSKAIADGDTARFKAGDLDFSMD